MLTPGNLGAEGRVAAKRYLEDHGFRVLDQRWQHPDGQLDIVAVDNATLVVCELRNRLNVPLGTIPSARRRLLRSMAVDWLQGHGMRFDQIRIDIVGLVYDGASGFAIEHVRGVG